MEKRFVNVGLYDMDFFDLNFGVNALGICHILMLDKISQKLNIPIKFTIFTPESQERVIDLFKEILNKELNVVTVRPISIRHPSVFYNYCKEVKKCDFVIDATGGDSFSDIYGNTRYIRGTICKVATTIRSRLVLAPQTIGPFKSKFNEKFAALAMNRSRAVCVRDQLSYDYIKKIAPKAKLELASDVAMGLPFDRGVYHPGVEGKINIGINISGLLWKGGYTGDNQFDLLLNYAELMKRVIKHYADNEKYKIHLIAHVIEDGAYEDDYSACQETIVHYPQVILAPKFTNPIDAKNYICHMDLFMGARMHATIGAFSSGVPTVPIAYSRKFEGVFDSIGYDINIDCKKLSTDGAYTKVIELIDNYEAIKTRMREPLAEAKRRIDGYEKTLIRLVKASYK